MKIPVPMTVLLTIICMASPALAEDNTVAGHYYLINQMETASQLLLKPDHTFQWWLAVGSADYRANGTWRTEGDQVIIETEKSPPLSGSPKFVPFNAKEADRLPSPVNRRQVAVAVKNVGGVPDLDVVFETTNGQRYQSKTNHQGIALADIPPQGTWARVGLRHQDDRHDYTWFALADLQISGNSVAFWVKDKKWAMKQPFATMTFVQGTDTLTSTTDNMVYKK